MHAPEPGVRWRARRTAAVVLVVVGLLGLHRVWPSVAAEAPHRTVVLISLDGFRADYLTRFPTPNLHALAASGVRAEWLTPVFPSKTFPNHYTIVTGLYPEHHGVVANTMEDPAIGQRFTMSAATAKDPRWWSGEPIWNTAHRQGLRSASMFWPGADVPIAGQYPDYWMPYDGTYTNEQRVTQVLQWLALPERERPSLVTLYFSTVDSAGHDFGPDSPQLADAVATVDALVGALLSGVERLGQTSQVTFVVVSDHGMTPVDRSHVIFMDDYIDLSWATVTEFSPVFMANPTVGHTTSQLLEHLRSGIPHLTVYQKGEMPERYHYSQHPRIPDVIGVADEGWTVTSHERFAKLKDLGDHGYDPTLESMRAVFIAAGAGVRQGVTAPPLENIHLYDFMCALLGITPAPNDGDASVTRPFLAN